MINRVTRLALLSLAVATPSLFAEEVTTDRLQKITDSVSDSKPEGELAAYPLFEAEPRSHTISRSSDSGIAQKIRFRCYYSGEGYVVQTREPIGKPDDRLTDVIGYDESAKIFRRWRIQGDGSIVAMIGIREANDWALAFTPQATSSSFISWSGVAGSLPEGVDSISALERLDSGGTPETRGISWKCRYVSGEIVSRSESFNIREKADGIPVSQRSAPSEFPKQQIGREPEKNATKLLDQLISGARSRRGNAKPAETAAASNSSKATQLYHWHDRGLSLRLPVDRKSIAVPPEQVHSNAILAVYQPDPFQTDLVISHSDDAAESDPNAIETWIRKGVSDLRANIPDVRVDTFDEFKLGERPVCRTYSFSPYEPQTMRCHTFLTHANRSYEVVTSVLSDDTNVAQSAADKFLSQMNFAPNAKAAPTNHSYPQFGMRCDVANLKSGDEQSKELRELYPAAQLTCRFATGDFIAVVPADLSRLEIDDEKLREGLIACTHSGRLISVRETEDMTTGTARGTRIVGVLSSKENLPLTQESRLLRNGPIAIAVVAGMFQRGSETEKLLKKRLDAIEFFAADSGHANDDDNLPTNHLALNKIGQTLVRDGHYSKAVEFFSAAEKADPKNPDYRKNADRAKRLAELKF